MSVPASHPAIYSSASQPAFVTARHMPAVIAHMRFVLLQVQAGGACTHLTKAKSRGKERRGPRNQPAVSLALMWWEHHDASKVVIVRRLLLLGEVPNNVRALFIHLPQSAPSWQSASTRNYMERAGMLVRLSWSEFFCASLHVCTRISLTVCKNGPP